jgi:hypothetical protein
MRRIKVLLSHIKHESSTVPVTFTLCLLWAGNTCRTNIILELLRNLREKERNKQEKEAKKERGKGKKVKFPSFPPK